MKKRILLLVAGLVLMLAAGASAKGFGPDGNKGRFIDDLKLSAQQEDSLSKIRFEQKKKMIELRSKVMIAKVEYRELLRNRNFSTDKAKKMIEKISSLKTEIAMTKLGFIDQTRKILTDEQWKIFSKRMGHKRHPKRGFGPMPMGKAPQMHFEGRGF